MHAVLASGPRLDLLQPHAAACDDAAGPALRHPSDEGPVPDASAGPSPIHAIRPIEFGFREVVNLLPHAPPLVDQGFEVVHPCGSHLNAFARGPHGAA